MNYNTFCADNAITQFKAILSENGINPPFNLNADGKLHRCDTTDKNGKGDAAYLLHLDEIPAGFYENFQTGVRGTWRADIGRKLTPTELASHEKRIESARRQRDNEIKQRHEQAAIRARQLWDSAKPVINHPYLTNKKIRPHGVRVRNDKLLIPLVDECGKICSLQSIDNFGNKKFLTGGKVKDCYYSIGEISEDKTTCITEGFATAASIYEATGYPVVVAFSADKLTDAAIFARKKAPNAIILICADDDYQTAGNPGITNAKKAAETISGFVSTPNFGDHRPVGATDFNDLHNLNGLDEVKTQILKAGEDVWPELQTIVFELPPVEKFNGDVLLPEPLREWVQDEAERMSAPPDFIAAGTVTILGSIVGASCAIKPKTNDNWVVVPNLWGGIVGLPSVKKTPSFNAPLKFIDRIENLETEKNTKEINKHNAEIKVFEAKMAALEKDLKNAAAKKDVSDSSLKCIATSMEKLENEKPVAPPARRFKTNDATVEKVADLLVTNPAGLLVVRDELVGLLSSWEKPATKVIEHSILRRGTAHQVIVLTGL